MFDPEKSSNANSPADSAEVLCMLNEVLPEVVDYQRFGDISVAVDLTNARFDGLAHVRYVPEIDDEIAKGEQSSLGSVLKMTRSIELFDETALTATDLLDHVSQWAMKIERTRLRQNRLGRRISSEYVLESIIRSEIARAVAGYKDKKQLL